MNEREREREKERKTIPSLSIIKRKRLEIRLQCFK